jgi:hypothetical protein
MNDLRLSPIDRYSEIIQNTGGDGWVVVRAILIQTPLYVNKPVPKMNKKTNSFKVVVKHNNAPTQKEGNIKNVLIVFFFCNLSAGLIPDH